VWCECGRGLSLHGKWIYCPSCGSLIDQESYVSAIEQATRNGATNFYRDPDTFEETDKTLDRLRAAMVDVFGGIGKGSPIWGSTQWDKGWTAGIQAAILAFDTERKK
jgi:hypothetical protein